MYYVILKLLVQVPLLPVPSNQIAQIHGAGVHIMPSGFPPEKPQSCLTAPCYVACVCLRVVTVDAWSLSASLKHEGLNSSSQETRKATSPGIKLMLFGHLTESVPLQLAESISRTQSQQASAHTSYLCPRIKQSCASRIWSFSNRKKTLIWWNKPAAVFPSETPTLTLYYVTA